MEQTPETMQKDVQDEDQDRELLGKLIKRGVLELKPRLSDVGVHYVEAEETINKFARDLPLFESVGEILR